MPFQVQQPLRVCIDARLNSQIHGGIVQSVIGLASGLSRLADGSEQYFFLVNSGEEGWLKPYMQDPCQMIFKAASNGIYGKDSQPHVLTRLRISVRRLGRFIRSGADNAPQSNGIELSDGTVERLGIGVMHFTTPLAFITQVPSIYQPWDLQHLHFPEYFSHSELESRELTYRTYCKRATMVAVAASWTKQDLIEQYDLPEDKIHVVPAGPVVTYYPVPSQEDLSATRSKFSLEEQFIFYPAQTWAHKNHLGILEALSILRDQHGLRVNFVSSGRMNEYYAIVDGRVRELGLTEQVRFLGFVSELELQCLYRLCRCLIFPSKFEGFGLPVVEALYSGIPTACSNVTTLPEVAGDAALFFDPDDPYEIAEAITRLWLDDDLCRSLVRRGKNQANQFSWDKSSRLFRAHYRKIANKVLTEEDRSLLSSQSK